MNLTKEKPKKIKILFEKARNLTPAQKKAILDLKKKLFAPIKPVSGKVLPTMTDMEQEIENAVSSSKNESSKELPKVDKNLDQEIRSMTGDIAGVEQVNSAVENGVNAVYGSKGFLGVGAEQGILSKDWNFMKKLKMAEILKYYHGDSSASVMKPEIIKVLSSSDKHYKFMQEVEQMIVGANGALKPFESESVEDFLRRAVSFSLKNVAKIA